MQLLVFHSPCHLYPSVLYDASRAIAFVIPLRGIGGKSHDAGAIGFVAFAFVECLEQQGRYLRGVAGNGSDTDYRSQVAAE